MSQPKLEPMNTTEAEQAIEGFLDKNPLTDGGEDEVEETPTAEEVEESTEEESDEKSEDESEEESEEETDEEEQQSIETLKDLAEALELPLEEVMTNLKTTVKVNGEETSVTLKEAFDGYQKDADYRQKTTELSTQRKAHEEQVTGARKELENQLLQVGQLMQALEKAVVPELDQTQLQFLKETDPQAYLIQSQERTERLNQFKQLQQLAANQFAHNQQQLAQQQQAQMQEVFVKASEELKTRIPDWGEDVKKSLDGYLMSEAFGYTDQELSQVMDPRLIEIAHKAMLYDQQSKKAKVAEKKVKTLPKIQPKGSVSQSKPSSKKLQAAKARLKKTGSVEDAAAAVEQLLF